MRSNWREESEIVICEALLEYEAQQLCLGKDFNLKEAFKHVSSKYPFGSRENHPYKIWLDVVKKAKLLLSKYSVKELCFINWENAINEEKRKNKTKEKDEQQLLLF
jgi:hypothetical protein